MADKEKLLSSLIAGQAKQPTLLKDLSNNLPPWNESSCSQKLRIIFIKIIILFPVFILLFVFIGGYGSYVSLYIYNLIADTSDRPELYYWHSDSEKANAKTRGFTLLAIQSSLVLMLLICYFRAMFTDSGRIPAVKEWELDSDIDIENLEHDNRLTEKSTQGFVRCCYHCRQKKPDRSHHCRQCNRCSLKMDHHCNWIGNCVGYGNYKFFFLMIFYGSISIAVFICTFWECVVVVLNDLKSSTLMCFLVVFVYSLTCMLGVAVFGFFTFHVWLLIGNYTTIEYCEKKKKNLEAYSVSPFKSEKFWENISQALGENPFLWLVPVNNIKLDGGIYFKKFN